MVRRTRILTDEEVARLLSECGDRIRDHGGETREGEACLRAVEGFTRAMNEKLIVYLHFHDLHGAEAAEGLRRILDAAKRTND